MKITKSYLLPILFLILYNCSSSPTLLYEQKVNVSGYYQQQVVKAHEDLSGSILLAKKGEYPSWIPGVKTHFAYLERKSGSQDMKLWVAKEDGTNKTALTNFEIHFDYSWSPDGQWLLVSHTKDGNYEIYKLKKDGSKTVRLTNNSYTDQFPRWSPKGNKIVFVSSKGTMNNSLFLINADGTGSSKQITPASYNIYASRYSRPCWSSDGNFIAFIAASGTSFDVFIVNITNGKIQNITNNKRTYQHLCWYDNYLFYFDYNTLYRYNTVTQKVDPPTGLGNFPGEIPHSCLSANASHVFFSYGKDALKPAHIYKVQHYTGDLTDVGEGTNPNVW